MKRLSKEQLLAVNKFNIDRDEAHIILNKEKCAICTNKPCTFACPAGLYTVSEDGEINLDYAGCLECGTCRLVCPVEGALTWGYPRGGFGVIYRYG